MPTYSIHSAPSGHYFMGISLTSVGFFSKKIVSNYIKSLNSNAISFTVLVADSLEKWNYMYFKNYSEYKAYKKAKTVGKQFYDGYIKLSHIFPHLNVILSSDIEKMDNFNSMFSIIWEYYNSNINFQYDVKKQVKRNLKNKLGDLEAKYISDILSLYLIEEVAITVGIYSGSILSKMVQISPKIDILLNELYNNTYPDLFGYLNLDSNDLQYVTHIP